MADKARRPQRWSPQPRDETERKIVEVAEIALAHAAKLGASMAETGVGQGQGMSVTVRNGAVETVEHNRDKSLAVTVYFRDSGDSGNPGGGYKSGSASTSDLREPAIRQSVASACSIAKFTQADACNGLAERDRLATEFPDLDLFHPWQPTIDQAIETATDCEQAALRHDRRIGNSEGATLSSHQGVDLYANSDGFRGLTRGTRHSIGCSVIAGVGDSMQRDYWYDSARDANDLAAPQAIGAQAARRTLRRLGARKIRTGEYPVLFEPTVATSLLSHLVGAVSGASLYRKASFLLDKAGERIFPEGIRIHEQPRLARSPGGASFDGEGVATAARDLVSDGVLRGYVLNSYSARKLNTGTTANAGGVRNLEIQATSAHRLDEIIAEMGRGLVVSELIGFGVNTVTGDYSRGAFGFWVDNGEVQYPVQEFTIAGNLSQIFSGLVCAGADLDARRNLRAGSILIENMTIAGQ